MAVQDTDFVTAEGLAEAMAGADSSALSAYPVGSIYLSVSGASPSTLFGGTWERIQDRFLLCAGTAYAAGSTGGEAKHTLTVDEMPSHRHTVKTYSSSGQTGGCQPSGYGSSGSVNTGYSGGGAAHNNMPPYLAVYVWKRTA